MFLIFGIALALPFGVCLWLARKGEARRAWQVPGGLAVLTGAAALWALWLDGSEASRGAFGVVAVATLPAILGGVAGILAGRLTGRRAR
jgi:hypothetical protein